MKLWEFLSERIKKHENNIVFDDGCTYGELLNEVNNRKRKYDTVGRLVVVEQNTRKEQAIEILAVLASQNVVIPVDDCYGQNRVEPIKEQIKGDDKCYDDLAFLMFTSGTTGQPKGVMLSHENIIENIKMISTYFQLNSDDSILIIRPLVHIAVITGELLYGLYCGSRIVFYEEEFNPYKLSNIIKQKEITTLCATPTIFEYLILSNNEELRLKQAVISGERLKIETVRKLIKAFPCTEFYNVYGLTEHSPRVSALTPSDFFQYPGSVGKPLNGVATKIEGNELFVKSKCVMVGYYNNEEETLRFKKDEWLRTGDIVEENHGYLYIKGRKDNMIIRGGVNIYPEEIEDVVKCIEGVSDCYVYGEDDILCGQRIVLEYIGTVDEKTLRKELVRIFPPHLLAKKIVRRDQFEMTCSGKRIRK